MSSTLSTELFVTKFKKRSSSNKGIVWAARKKTKKGGVGNQILIPRVTSLGCFCLVLFQSV